jgi:hypothetical protein
VIRLDGFDDCIVGTTDSWNGTERVWRLVYDANLILQKLGKEGMDEEEAFEYYEFNIAGLYAGEGTPIFVSPLDANEVADLIATQFGNEGEQSDDEDSQRVA